MARGQYPNDTWTRGAPHWCGDYLEAENLMRGPHKLDPAAFTANGAGKKVCLGGTLLGRTYAEKDAGTGFGPWAAGDEEVAFAAFDVLDIDKLADVELIKPHIKFQIKKNYLPVALNASQLTAARVAGYDMINGYD